MGEVIYLEVYKQIRQMVKESGYTGLKPMKVYREEVKAITDFLKENQ